MLKSSPSAPEVHARVTTLPEEYLVRRTADHWVIVGPTGLFCVGKAGSDLEAATRRTAMAAHLLRNRLSEAVDVVPFVDAVVVAERGGDTAACATVASDLLGPYLTDGPKVISEGELQLLRHHVPIVVTRMEADGELA